MSTLREAKRVHDFMHAEFDYRFCRELKTALSGQSLVAGDVVCSDSTGKKLKIVGTGNEIHTYTPNANPTGGTYKIRVYHSGKYWVETGWLAYNATNTVIAAALNALLGTSAVAVNQALSAGAVTLTFSGTGYASLSWPLGQLDVSRLVGTATVAVTRSTSAGAARNEVQTVAIGGSPSAGSFKIGVQTPAGGFVWTDTVAHNANFATVISTLNSAFDDVLGASKIVATGAAYTAITLTFSGSGYAGLAQPLVEIDVGALTGATTSSVARTTSGGLAGNRLGQMADGVTLQTIDASAGDVIGVFLTRGPAVVDSDQLAYYGGDPASVATALQALGIMCRSEPTLQQMNI